MIKISIRQLEIFRAIAQQKNMTRAAQKIGLTQSAASMALKELENALGGILFHRKGKKLALTDFGEILLKEADVFLDHAKKIGNLTNNPAELKGEIKIGASSTLGNYILPSYLLKFKRQHPEVHIELIISNTENILKKLLTWDLDLGFVEGPNAELKINTEFWLADELMIICKKNHPLTHKKRITPNDLASYPWILRESGSGTLTVVEHFITENMQLKVPWLRLGSSEAIKIAVAQSEALSILSRFVLSDDLAQEKIQTLKLPKLQCTRKLYKVSLKGRSQSFISSAFQQFLSEKLIP